MFDKWIICENQAIAITYLQITINISIAGQVLKQKLIMIEREREIKILKANLMKKSSFFNFQKITFPILFSFS